MTEPCMRTPEAAQYLGISVSTLNKTRLTGDGPPFIKVTPRAVAYRKADLDAFLEAHVRRSTSDSSTDGNASHVQGGGDASQAA